MLEGGGAFARAAYPGVAVEELPPHLPRSLGALLSSADYAAPVAQTADRAVAKAEAVLAGAKSRGAAAGERMDSATEAALWPQIYSEAFARELLVTLSQLSRDTHAALASDDALLASPYHVLARGDQVTVATLAALVGPLPGAASAAAAAAGWAQQQGPFDGEDASTWADLALADALRFAEEQPARFSSPITARGVLVEEWQPHALLGAGGAAGSAPSAAAASAAAARTDQPAAGTPCLQLDCALSWAWVEPGPALEAEYPALHEVLSRLHALPFELNRKQGPLRLTQPQPGMTLVRRYRLRAQLKMAAEAEAPAADARSGTDGAAGGVNVAVRTFQLTRSGRMVHGYPFGDEFALDAGGAARGGATGTGPGAAAKVAPSGGAVDAGYKVTCLALLGSAAADDETAGIAEAAGAAGAGGDTSADGEVNVAVGAAGSRAAPRTSLHVELGTALGEGERTSGDATVAAGVDCRAANALVLYRSRGVGTRVRLECKLPREPEAGSCAASTDVVVVTFFMHGRDDRFN
jgi:hypothetical protein